MNSMELSNYLERVRLGRKVTQEEFVDGIVSLRQYQRYRSGECEIPYEKLQQFADKLGIPSKKLLNEFEQEKHRQLKLINDLYNAVVNRNRSEAKRLQSLINQEVLIEEETKLHYDHALILYEYLEKKTTRDLAISRLLELVNYPKVLKQSYFTDIEVLILSTILELDRDGTYAQLLEHLSKLYDDEERILSSGKDFVHAVILMRLSKKHGERQNYNDVIGFCNLGIKRGIYYKQYYLLEYFFYYKALAWFALEDFEEYENALFKCYNVLQLEGNKKKNEMFIQWIEKDFNIHFDNFALRFLKKRVT